MNLNDALTQIANDAGLNADELISYAAEDTVGGRDTGDFAAMSVHRDEGRVIYALVRALRPKQCLEIGVADGCTSTHILAALARNGAGQLLSVDISPEVGRNIPEELQGRWTFTCGDAMEIKLPKHVDFILEDGPHTYPWTRDIVERLLKLTPRMIVAHDALTHLTYKDQGFEVLRSYEEVLGDKVRTVGIDGAFTGLAYYVNGVK